MQTQELFSQAHEAGLTAGNAITPNPMVVQRHANMMNDSSPVAQGWIVPDGPCGFAWINTPGTSAFARWLKKTGKARKSYAGGYNISVSEFGQSMSRKEAYANAFAKVLTAEGVTACAESRMD